jgi:hypothetical protein
LSFRVSDRRTLTGPRSCTKKCNEGSHGRKPFSTGNVLKSYDTLHFSVQNCISVRKICIFGAHHKYQFGSPINPFYAQHLRELIRDHQVDTVFEEATSLPPKSCVEVLAEGLGIDWMNMDIGREQRATIDDAALRSRYDTFQDLTLHECRERFWIDRISESESGSGLVLCGSCHVLSLGERLRRLRTRTELPCFEVEAHVYDPRRDEL